MLEPKDLLEKLEFNKVLELIVRECYGELGKEAVRAMPVETELPVIERKLREVAEYKLALEKNDQVPLSEYHDIYPDLRMLEVVDYVLSEESFKRIGAILLLVRDLNQFFTPGRQPVYPHLYDIMRSVAFDEGLIEAIERVIDDKGEIRSDASPELLKIRKATQAKQRELERVFRSLINEYRNKGWLTDNVESFRNGRRVLSVPAEHKRKIRGIIHDESTSGKTAFIEPGSPWENGYCESFNARFRDELLNAEVFYSLREAQILIERWRRHYNTVRPHSSLGYRPPAPEAFVPMDQRPTMH